MDKESSPRKLRAWLCVRLAILLLFAFVQFPCLLANVQDLNRVASRKRRRGGNKQTDPDASPIAKSRRRLPGSWLMLTQKSCFTFWGFNGIYCFNQQLSGVLEVTPQPTPPEVAARFQAHLNPFPILIRATRVSVMAGHGSSGGRLLNSMSIMFFATCLHNRCDSSGLKSFRVV